jgi:eukaryotic-like serine/threonine-protein kinase
MSAVKSSNKSDQRQSRIREIFLEALATTDLAQRKAWLDITCVGDGELRTRVEALLRNHREDTFLETPARDLSTLGLSDIQSSGIVPPAGSFIGRYKIVEPIGEGGFGVVFMAEQQQPVRRAVALKVIKAGMDTRQVIARFEAERQALAMMDHPSIAKVLDGGETENGRLYFVMELVCGTKITDYCNENNLPTRERLELFIQVCQAVQHAHQKGIIHRDLKPSNILVSSDPNPNPSDKLTAIPKIIDFGIAKATQGRLTEETIHTAFHQFMGTPAYISPEQAQLTTEDIDTRSDIYSLGVLLYELLTGKPPFDNHELLTAGLDEMRRIIREEEPERPSIRLWKKKETDPAKLSKLQTDPDLDCIVLKCLEKDRNRRYQTAGALASDLGRYLSDEPIDAQPATSLYRFRKLVRRHQIAVASAILVFLVILVGIAATSWQAVRATNAEQKTRLAAENALRLQAEATKQAILASEQAENAKAVQNFLAANLLGVNGYYGAPDPDALSYTTTQAIVEKISRAIQGSFPNQPLVEADVRFALARAYSALRKFSDMEPHSARAWKIRADHLGIDHNDTLEAQLLLASCRFHLNAKTNAYTLLKDAIGKASRGTNAILQAALDGTYGSFLVLDGLETNALPYLRRAVTVHEQILSPRHSWTRAWKLELVRALEFSGNTLEAITLYQSELDQAARGGDSDVRITDFFRFGLARALLAKKQATKSMPLLEQIIVFRKEKLPPNDFATLDAQYWLGQAYDQTGQTSAAVTLYREIFPRIAEHLPYYSARYLCIKIADFYVREHHTDEAKAALEILRHSFEATPPSGPADFEKLDTINRLTSTVEESLK